MRGSVLFDDIPLLVPTQLARHIGLNEAIVLQQVHYWIIQNERAERNYYEGSYWVYNSLTAWQEQFPFWTGRGVKKIIARLEEKGFLITGNFNKLQFDRTKWYRIDYVLLEQRVHSIGNRVPHRLGTGGTMDGEPCSPTIPETNTEINTETKSPYGEFQNVMLTVREYESLLEKCGRQAGELIERLSSYMESRGRRYKSHYATLLNWSRRDKEKGEQSNSRRLPAQYTPSPNDDRC